MLCLYQIAACLLAGADVLGIQDLVRHLDIRVPVAEADHVDQLRLAQLQQLPPIVLLQGRPTRA